LFALPAAFSCLRSKYVHLIHGETPEPRTKKVCLRRSGVS